MLTRPDIDNSSITTCLWDTFGLSICQVSFLPIGADVNSAAFRVIAGDGAPYFLKLRRGAFDDVSVTLPAFLHAQGIRSVMAPLATRTNQLWTRVESYNAMLYPYFEGSNGFETSLSRPQWIRLGKSLRDIHRSVLPIDIAARIRREDYSPRDRGIVAKVRRQAGESAFPDPIAARFATLWTTKREEIDQIVERAERLATLLQKQTVGLVVCHADLHGGNVIVGPDDKIAIVDWDEPILAPKERDLMFVGAGIGDVWNQERESAWFFEGYGTSAVDPRAIAYYRYERIVADLAAYAAQILGAEGSAEDREEGLRQVAGQFKPGGVVGIAHESYLLTE